MRKVACNRFSASLFTGRGVAGQCEAKRTKTAALVLGLFAGLCIASGAAQAQDAQEASIWAEVGVGSSAGVKGEAAPAKAAWDRKSVPQLQAFRRYAADPDRLRETLRAAPPEFRAGYSPLLFSVPMPDGSMENVRIEESPIFSPELQARYPEIRTYKAIGVDDPTLTGRLDMTPIGFHSMLLSSRGAAFVDPVQQEDGSIQYVSYWKKDMVGEPFRCDTHPGDTALSGSVRELFGVNSAPLIPFVAIGGTLRTYRMAISVTGEYTRFFDGNPPTAGTPNTIAQIAATVNRVTGIYEREIDVRLNLVATRIFTDPATDPFPPGSNDLRSENQTELDTNVGNANYDFGHIFSQGGSGGVADLGSVCVSGSKARGSTNRGNPSGDAFDVDYVAHEMGHQLGGNHTWTSNTGSCAAASQFVATAAYEPGSGSTIMAYAGICSPQNVQANSDAYFHTKNYDEIYTFTGSGSGSTCGTTSSTGNNPPTVSAGSACTVPQSTPFTLTASGSDPDSDPLTYLWEQYDTGTHGQIPAPTNASGPMFRSRPATSSPSRTFPRMADILSGAATPWEVLPSVDRTLNFRVTARDNRAGGGGVNNASTAVTVSGSQFAFTAPTSGQALECGDSATVSWNVGGGSIAPDVAIQYSTDGGANFSTLVASTPNDGSHNITVPTTLMSTGRMKLVPSSQCFFAVSRQFQVHDTTPPSITAPANITLECTSPNPVPVSLGTPTTSDLCDPTLLVTNNAPATFSLGTTIVTWTSKDDSLNQASANQTVKIQDTTPPVISCNNPATIAPKNAPISFTATAADVCDTSTPAVVTGFKCYTVLSNGKVIDKGESCVVSFSAGVLTITNSGGVDDIIEWTVTSSDDSGNTANKTCKVTVINPNK